MNIFRVGILIMGGLLNVIFGQKPKSKTLPPEELKRARQMFIERAFLAHRLKQAEKEFLGKEDK